ncbi:pyridoxamine 5'-phosphate oxidase family protein [Prevotella aurantiaca]
MKEALDFLKHHKDVAFATCEGNRPKIRTFQIMCQEGSTLYFATSEKKEVYKQLQQNPHVEILAMEDKVSVRCVGEVNFNVDDERKRWIYDHNDVLLRLYSSYDMIAYFALEIAEIDYYDLSTTPPVLQHFNLVAETKG